MRYLSCRNQYSQAVEAHASNRPSASTTALKPHRAIGWRDSDGIGSKRHRRVTSPNTRNERTYDKTHTKRAKGIGSMRYLRFRNQYSQAVEAHASNHQSASTTALKPHRAIRWRENEGIGSRRYQLVTGPRQPKTKTRNPTQNQKHQPKTTNPPPPKRRAGKHPTPDPKQPPSNTGPQNAAIQEQCYVA